MNFGSTLIGAVLGALVGVAIYMGVYNGAGIEAPWVAWLAILTGLLAGLGVRKFNPDVAMNASYARGALSALIALGGIMGGSMAASKVRQEQLKNVEVKASTVAVADQPAEGGDESEEAGDEPAEIEAPEVTAPPVTLGPAVIGSPKRPQRGVSLWDIAPIAIGCFLAYELARGGGSAPAATSDGDGPELPPESDPVAAAGNSGADAENKDS